MNTSFQIYRLSSKWLCLLVNKINMIKLPRSHNTNILCNFKFINISTSHSNHQFRSTQQNLLTGALLQVADIRQQLQLVHLCHPFAYDPGVKLWEFEGLQRILAEPSKAIGVTPCLQQLFPALCEATTGVD